MKVVMADVEPWEEEILSRCVQKDRDILNRPFNLNDTFTYHDTELLCVFLHSKIDSHIIAHLPKLKYIITRSTGYDHVDLEACKRRKIKVLNVPSYGTETVAEHTFALILALAKKIPQAIERAKEGKWEIHGLQGIDLSGKTLGIIGLGKIGYEVARKAKAFNMKVIASTIDPDPKIAKSLGLSYVSIDELLQKSDFISLHTPLAPATRHMINLKNISMIKKGAYLINTARGELIQTSALIKAIDSGILAGAALDVLEGEQNIAEEHELLQNKKISHEKMQLLLENHDLLREKNVLVTPHTAFYTQEALQRILETTCDNLLSCLHGKPVNLVN